MTKKDRARFVLTVSMCSAAMFVAGAALADPMTIEPGGNVQERLQEALILAEKGQVIELGAGVFEFTRSLSLDVDGVTLRGQGLDETILSFKKQDAGSEGLIVTSDGVTLENFAIEDTIGDGIKVKGAEGITMRNIRVEWTGGPKSTNGAYGLYPVESTNVYIEGCISIGASDAGIYVGQSEDIIVKGCRVEYNVAGIEIENCYRADVFDCVATHNTGGILIFDLPNLPKQGGHDVRVFNNIVKDNDTDNFAPKGNIVGTVPTGTGILIMANRNVEIFQNELSGNDTANLIISAYLSTEGEATDPDYYPFPEGIHIHHNTFATGGKDPKGVFGIMMAAIAGKPLPDIVWDGRINREKFASGTVPVASGISIHDNGDADFVNLDLESYMSDPSSVKVTRNILDHADRLPAIPAVALSGGR